jgi:hypothetical protein
MARGLLLFAGQVGCFVLYQSLVLRAAAILV